jgi:hypothetical protein
MRVGGINPCFVCFVASCLDAVLLEAPDTGAEAASDVVIGECLGHSPDGLQVAFQGDHDIKNLRGEFILWIRSFLGPGK